MCRILFALLTLTQRAILDSCKRRVFLSKYVWCFFSFSSLSSFAFTDKFTYRNKFVAHAHTNHSVKSLAKSSDMICVSRRLYYYYICISLNACSINTVRACVCVCLQKKLMHNKVSDTHTHFMFFMNENECLARMSPMCQNAIYHSVLCFYTTTAATTTTME